jgi:hypothetical protein
MASEPEVPHAPEGASCAEHPERNAHFTCPRCGSFACASCWHPSVARCTRCLRRDPTEAAPPIAWEQAGRSLPARYLATLASAFSPLRSAPAFAHSDVRAAQRFALLSAAPFALLAGIIPHTRTLLFKSNLQVEVLGNAGTTEIALDILRAAGVQLTITLVELLCLMLPFVSLVRAYAPGKQHAAARVLYYRLWMRPFTWLLLFAAVWLVPEIDPKAPGAALALLTALDLLRSLIAPVLLFMAMGATARMACGLGPGVSIIVVTIPAILLFVVQGLLQLGVDRLLPALATGAAPAG